MRTEPTTMAGLHAMLAHLAGYVAAGYQLPELVRDRRRFTVERGLKSDETK
jgi:hypothetical protein